jgi:hypothetical protein
MLGSRGSRIWDSSLAPRGLKKTRIPFTSPDHDDGGAAGCRRRSDHRDLRRRVRHPRVHRRLGSQDRRASLAHLYERTQDAVEPLTGAGIAIQGEAAGGLFRGGLCRTPRRSFTARAGPDKHARPDPLGYASPRQQFHRGFSHRRRTPSGKNSIPAFSSASVTFSMRSVS